jgi:hypothetical protein
MAAGAAYFRAEMGYPAAYIIRDHIRPDAKEIGIRGTKIVWQHSTHPATELLRLQQDPGAKYVIAIRGGNHFFLTG